MELLLYFAATLSFIAKVSTLPTQPSESTSSITPTRTTANRIPTFPVSGITASTHISEEQTNFPDIVSYSGLVQTSSPQNRVSTRVALQIYNNQEKLRSLISEYFTYNTTDGDLYKIEDGGDNMFDGGNMIEVSDDNGTLQQLKYGESYDWYPHADVSSAPSSPFTAVVWIDNSDGTNQQDFHIRVHGSRGGDRTGYTVMNVYENQLYLDSYQINYVSYQIAGPGQPATIVEVYFAISSAESWGSSNLWPLATQSRNAWGSFSYSDDLDNLDSKITFSSATKRTLAVYTLLSRENGKRTSRFEVETYLRGAAQIIIDGNPLGEKTLETWAIILISVISVAVAVIIVATIVIKRRQITKTKNTNGSS